jgi:hypothetical protein
MSASLRIACVVACVAMATRGVATAQSRTATFNVAIAGAARLSISPTSIAFPDSDPTAVPVVPAQPGPVSITVKARATPNATVRLTLRATDDLRSGVTTIPASTVTWTATGAGFAAGTLSMSAQTVGTWIGSGVRTGTQNFLFANSWSYAVGTYTVTMQYTVSSP